MSPSTQDVSPVPPCGTVTAALSVRTVALALGNVKVLVDVAGPLTAKKPLFVPPLAEGSIPATLVVRSIDPASMALVTLLAPIVVVIAVVPDPDTSPDSVIV